MTKQTYSSSTSVIFINCLFFPISWHYMLVGGFYRFKECSTLCNSWIITWSYIHFYIYTLIQIASVRIISLLKVEGKLSQLEDVQLTPWNEILMSFILHVSTTILTVLLYRMRATRNPTSTPCCACPIKSKDSTVICTHNYHRIETRCWIQFFFFICFSVVPFLFGKLWLQ